MKKNRKQMGRKLLSVGLSLLLLAGALPLSAAAAEDVKTTGIMIGKSHADQVFPIGTEGGKAAWNSAAETLTFSGTGTIEVSGDKDTALDFQDDINSPQIVVAENADITLRTTGGASHTVQTKQPLTIKVEKHASLQVENTTNGDGQDAILSDNHLTIEVKNSGVLKTTGSNVTFGAGLYAKGVTINNSGTLISSGADGIHCTFPGLVSIGGGGTTLIYGNDDGIFSSSNSITVEKNVCGVIAGGRAAVRFASGVSEPVITNNSATCLTVDNASAELLAGLGNADAADYSNGLDLINVQSSRYYSNVGGGTAFWEYKGGDFGNPHKLTLVGANTGNLALPGGVVNMEFSGENEIGKVTMNAGDNSLTLGASGIGASHTDSLIVTSADGVLFTGVTGVGIASPLTGHCATAVAGETVGAAKGIPGSAYPADAGGSYYPREGDGYFKLEYGAVNSEYVLTVENGFGGGVYGEDTPVSISFDAENYSAKFARWKAVDGEGNEIQDSQSWFENPKGINTTFTMPARNVRLQAEIDEGGNPNPPPSLERGEHIAYFNGYGDGTIRPERNLTREETAQLFYNLMDESSRAQYESADCPFPDVEKSKWSYQAICTLSNAGILLGDSKGNFRPTDTVTRAEFAAIAARFDPGTYTGEDLFPDIENHWARAYINYAAYKKWVQGYEDGAFRPNGKITRAEAATFINRVLERAPETVEDLLPGRKVFTDNTDESKWYYLPLEEAANSHDYSRKDYFEAWETWTALR